MAAQAKRARADQLLVELGLAPTRSKAQALLLAGRVYANQQRVDKAGTLLPIDCPLEVRGRARFVSRGGDKLDGALLDLGVAVAGWVAADVGASTGGFTDCLLKHGARRVYAIDVGKGQLAHELRSDPRVVTMEGVNARHLTAGSLPEPVELVVIDASFISLAKLLPAARTLLAPRGRILALIKPQFEVGRQAASKGRGVVRDPELRQSAVDSVIRAVLDAGFRVLGDAPCRVRGPKGNLEHFVWAERTD